MILFFSNQIFFTFNICLNSDILSIDQFIYIFICNTPVEGYDRDITIAEQHM